RGAVHHVGGRRRAPPERADRVAHRTRRRLRASARSGCDREGPAGRVGLRLRAPDGPDEPEALHDRHVLHLDEPAVLLPVAEPRVRGGEIRWRRHQSGAADGRGPPGGEVRARARRGGRLVSDQQAYDLETVLLQLREMIDSARTMPMSASVLVNRDEALDLLDEALHSMPEELRQARWLLKEREEYLAQARLDAEDLVEEARVQAERMVERTEVAREARRVAQQVVANAE